jgi:hypothetical protein
VQCEKTSERRILHFLMLLTARGRTRETGSEMEVAGLLFFAKKKSFTAHMHRARAMARAGSSRLGAAGLKSD